MCTCRYINFLTLRNLSNILRVSSRKDDHPPYKGIEKEDPNLLPVHCTVRTVVADLAQKYLHRRRRLAKIIQINKLTQQTENLVRIDSVEGESNPH